MDDDGDENDSGLGETTTGASFLLFGASGYDVHVSIGRSDYHQVAVVFLWKGETELRLYKYFLYLTLACMYSSM